MSAEKIRNQMLKLLAKRSFAANRMRNFIAVLAIALTAVLFTSVTTVGMGALESLTLTMQMQKMSRSDAEFHYMTREQYEALKEAEFVKEAGLRAPVGFLTNTKRQNVELDVMDETEMKMVFVSLREGRMPETAGEIVASVQALRDLGAEPRLGAEVTIEFNAHGQEYSLPMVVSGWYEAVSGQTSYMVLGAAFMEAYPDIFRYTYHEDREITGTYFSDIKAAGTGGLQEKMDDFSRSVGGDPDNTGADHYLPGIINRMTNPQMSIGILLAAAAFAVLFIFCGYLLIYNVFDIAVMQDIRRYGLYRTIGMDRRQVKKMVNRQAMWLSLMGIPIGLLAGFLIGKATLPVVMSTIALEYDNVAAEVTPSPFIFLASALMTALTVFISTRKPVRAAAGVSPVEAFRYVEKSAGRRMSRKGTGGAGLSKLAWSNLGRNRRRSIFIMVSLMLCVVLLNCVGTASASLDVEKQVAQMIRTDFAVVHSQTNNSMMGFRYRDLALEERTIADIAGHPGVKDGTKTYKNTLEDKDVTFNFGIQLDDILEKDEDTGLQPAFLEGGYFLYLGEDGYPVCNVYGMEEAAVSRMKIVEGETDPRILYEKMSRGEGILLGVQAQMGSAEIDEVFDILEVGDVITVRKNGEAVKELPVLAKAALNGDDEEIGYVVAGPQHVGGDGLYLYLPAGVFEELYEEPSVYKYSFDAEEGERENVAAFLEEYMETENGDITYLSSDMALEAANRNKFMISFVGGVIGLIFGIAGILNLVNMLITSILSRRLEFAAMQSIGMTDRQLRRMVTFEGIYYALGAVVMGLVLAAALDQTLVKSICSNMWNFTFRMTMAPALGVSAVLILFAAVIPGIVLKVFNKGSIVEKLRVVE